MAKDKDQIEMDVALRILGDTGQFTKEVRSSVTEMKNLSRHAIQMADSVKRINDEFKSFSKHLKGTSLNAAFQGIKSGGLSTALINAQTTGKINQIRAGVADSSVINAIARAGKDRQRALREEVIQNLATKRVTNLGSTKAELSLQIEATKLREAELVNLTRMGRVRTETGKQVKKELSKERDILDQLIAKRQKLLDLEKTQSQIQRLSQKISSSGSLFRAAGIGQRSAELSGDSKLTSQFKKDRYRQVIEQTTLRLEQERIKALAGQASSVALYERRLASLQTSMKQYTEQVKQTEAAERRLAQQQAQSAKTAAKVPGLSYEQKLAQQREHSVARVIGDGGASIFKIQAQLAANYLVMNSLFNLIGFGSQFVLELDNSFRQLQAITDTTDTEMKGLKETIIDASQATRFMATDVANAATVLGQAGFTGRQIGESIKPIAEFATAVGSSLEEAVDVVTSSLSIFNMRAEETGYVANVLTGALNLSKLNMDKLALGLQYAGNTAAQSGVSFEELTAVLAAMSQSGIRSGSTLGTGLREVIVSLQAPTEELTTELSAVGLTLDDVDIKSRGLTAVLKTMKDAGFGSANAFRSMEVRGAAAYSAILNQVDTLEGLQQQFILSNAAVEANNVQMKSLSANADRLKNAFGTLIAEGASPLTTALSGTFGAMASLVNVISSWGPLAQTITLSLTGLVAGFVSLKLALLAAGLAGITPLLTGLRAYASVAGVATLASQGLGAAVRLALGPFGLITAAIVGVETALYALNGGFSATEKELDRLKANVDEAKGKYEEWQGRIESVDSQLKQIGDRYDILSKDQDALNTEVLKAVTSFGEFGLKLQVTGATVDSLTSSLSQLRSEFSKLAGAEADNAISSIQLQISALNSKAKSLAKGSVFNDPVSGIARFLGAEGAGKYTAALERGASFDPSQLTNSTERNKAETELTKSYQDLISLRGALKDLKLQFSKEGRSSLNYNSLRLEDALSGLEEAISTTSENLTQIKTLGPLTASKLGNQLENDPRVKSFLNKLNIARTQDSYSSVVQNLKNSNPGINFSDPKVQSDIVIPAVREHKRATAELIKGELEKLTNSIKAEQMSGANVGEVAIDQALNKYREEVNRWEQEYAARIDSSEKGLQKFNDKIQESIDETARIEEQNLDASFNSAKQAKDYTKLAALSKKKEEFVAKDIQRKIDDLKQAQKNSSFDSQKEVIGAQISALEEQKNIAIQEVRDNLSEALKEVEKTPAGVANMADKMKLINGRIAASNAELQAAIDQASLIKQGNETPGSKLYNRYSTQEILAMERDSQEKERILAKRQVSQYSREFQSLQKQTGRGKDYFASLGSQDIDQIEAMNGVSKDYVATLKAQQEVYTKLVEVQQKDMLLNGTGAPAVKGFYDQLKLAIEETVAANQGMGSSYSYLYDLITQTFESAKVSVGSFIKDAVTGTKTISRAFKDMATNILSSMLEIVSNKIAEQFVGSILGFAGRSLGSSSPTDITAYALGGYVRKAGGGGLPPRDIIPALLQPGEFVLRKQAVDALGRDNLDRYNALGSRTISSSPVPVFGTEQSKGSGTVNVYVVSPEARPSLTPEDVIVTISEDLAKGGKTKQLVKSIVMGK